VSGFGEFSGLLIHTAIVYRRQEVGGTYKKDRFGQPTRDEAANHLLACRCTAARGGEIFTDRMHDVAQATHSLFLEPGADLSEEDVVTVVASPIDDVETPFEEDPATVTEGLHEIVTRAEVLLARVCYDGTGEHHREARISTERQSGDAR
jgi:hypothetical protein